MERKEMKTFNKTSVFTTDGQTLWKFFAYGTSAERQAITETTNGSKFTEVDTGETYIFDADSGTWTKLATGGGGGAGAVIVHELPANPVDNQLYILDTDWTIHIHDENGWHTVGGQEIDKYLWETELTNGEIIYESTIKED